MTSMKLDAGCKVRLVGLKKQPEDNGREGHVIGFCEEKKRYKIALPRRSEPYNLKRENLELISLLVPKAVVPKADEVRNAIQDSGKQPPSLSLDTSKKRKRESCKHDVSVVATPENGCSKTDTVEILTTAPVAATAQQDWGNPPSGSIFQISKGLSLILRHKAVELGLSIRPDGFCLLAEVLNLSMMTGLKATQAIVEQITRTNEKQRFEIKTIDGQHMIRAVQGHSLNNVSDDEALQRLDLHGPLPEKCVHGTYSRHWTSILFKGLLAGGLGEKGHRNHIHLSPYDYNDKRVISGMRADCDIAIYIDLRKAIITGVPFFISKNQVILTKGEDGALSSKYFQSAINVRTGEVLFAVGASGG